MTVSYIAIALLLLIGSAVLVCLFNRRLRPIGLVALGLIAIGFLMMRVEVHRAPHAVVGREISVEDMASARVRALREAEVLRNQRIAGPLEDAVVQHSPDGSLLETYPDGMQIKQLPITRSRLIIRDADPAHGFYTGYSAGVGNNTRMKFTFGAMLVPLFAVFGLFMLLRDRGREPAKCKRTGLRWFAISAALLLLGGFLVVGGRRTEVYSGSDAEAWAETLQPRAPMPPQPPVPAEMVVAVPKALADLQQQAEDQAEKLESLEAIWSELTAPRIKLVEESEQLSQLSRQMLADAGRIVLWQSLPAVDPIIQSWLVDGVKAIVNASNAPVAKADAESAELQVEQQQVAAATARVEPSEAVDVTADAPIAPEGGGPASPTGTGAAAGTLSQQPAWVGQPPKHVGSAWQVVVSTDPFRTVGECRQQLENRLRYAVAERVRQLATAATGRSVEVGAGPSLADMGIRPEYIRHELCPEADHFEAVPAEGGEMKQAFALLRFTPQQEDFLVQRWQAANRGERPAPAYAGPPEDGPARATLALRSKAYTTGQRPEWVDQPPKLVGNVRRIVVSTEPFSTIDECYVQLEDRLRDAVAGRVRQLAQQVGGAQVESDPSLVDLGVGSDYILGELCPEPDFVETVKASFGDMKRAHALLEFTPPQDEFLLDRWRASARREGIFSVAAVSCGLMAGLAFAYGLLKVDTWTRGYYTKRLFLGAPAAIIAGGLAMGAMLGLIG